MRQFVFLLVALTLLAPTHSLSAESKVFTMYNSEVKVIKFGKIDRVAIGNPGVVTNSILPNGQLVLIANEVGITTMHIWFQDGQEKQFEIQVNERQNLEEYRILSRLLAPMHGVSISKIDDQLVVSGKATPVELERLNVILKKYKALNLVGLSNSTPVIKKMLSVIPNITLQEMDGYTVVTGEVSEAYSGLIKRVEKKYPQLFDMTTVQKELTGKMVYMKVRIMEVSKSLEDKLGINWDTTSFTGPSLAYGVEGSRNGGSILNMGDTGDWDLGDGITSLTNSMGYFGIATSITSSINLSEEDGDSVTLAEPMLSARSGGKATFLAGGEFPVPVVSADGQTDVEYKEYGIRLNIEPVVDAMNNVIASIETEVSDIDSSNDFGDYKGTKSRRTSTQVCLKPNQTLAISGLVKNDVGDSLNKVKWLGDIPILGALFRSKNFKNSLSELVIFVTPTVKEIGEPMEEEYAERGRRIQANFDEMTKGSKILD